MNHIADLFWYMVLPTVVVCAPLWFVLRDAAAGKSP